MLRVVKTLQVPDYVEIEIADIAGERIAILSWPHSPEPTTTTMTALSAAEEVIVRCIAAGMSNAQIAAERGTSVRTVANQVAGLLKKLGVASRYELVVRLAGGGSL